MYSKAQSLHNQSTVMLTHDHTMYALAKRRMRGGRSVFTNHYAPLIRQGGVNAIGIVIGGDPPFFSVDTDDPRAGSEILMDMLLQEADESNDTIKVCLNSRDIDDALAEGIIAVIAIMEGALPICEGSSAESIAALQSFYKSGLRSLQFIGQDWNRLINADGREHPAVSDGLSPLGNDVVREMNHLGMVIDMAHVPDPDPLFEDVINTSKDPVIDSHRCVQGVTDIPRNISNSRIKAIAETGGVIGIQFFSETLTNSSGKRAVIEDLVRHIDHIINAAGIDHVALGPDFLEPELINRDPGHYAEGIEDITTLPLVTEALVKHGYTDNNIRKILGENILRVYRQVMG